MQRLASCAQRRAPASRTSVAHQRRAPASRTSVAHQHRAPASRTSIAHQHRAPFHARPRAIGTPKAARQIPPRRMALARPIEKRREQLTIVGVRPLQPPREVWQRHIRRKTPVFELGQRPGHATWSKLGAIPQQATWCCVAEFSSQNGSSATLDWRGELSDQEISKQGVIGIDGAFVSQIQRTRSDKHGDRKRPPAHLCPRVRRRPHGSLALRPTICAVTQRVPRAWCTGPVARAS